MNLHLLWQIPLIAYGGMAFLIFMLLSYALYEVWAKGEMSFPTYTLTVLATFFICLVWPKALTDPIFRKEYRDAMEGFVGALRIFSPLVVIFFPIYPPVIIYFLIFFISTVVYEKYTGKNLLQPRK